MTAVTIFVLLLLLIMMLWELHRIYNEVEVSVRRLDRICELLYRGDNTGLIERICVEVARSGNAALVERICANVAQINADAVYLRGASAKSRDPTLFSFQRAWPAVTLRDFAGSSPACGRRSGRSRMVVADCWH